MEIQRLIYRHLLSWKSSENRKSLVVRGARQVGKTTLVDDFSKEYLHCIRLNLEKADHSDLFKRFRSPAQIMDVLLIQNNLPAEQLPNTLLFIDEIQESPEAMAMLRFFYEEMPDQHVIAAGSLLEHALSSFRHYPVGRIQFLYIFPFSFKEYLLANRQDQLLERLEKIPVSDTVHEIAKSWFHKYAIVGGMPEVVINFVENQSVSSLQTIYESIWSTYREDVVKYAANETAERVIRHIMNTAPLYLDQRITFENFGKSNYRSREVGESFRSLDDAKVIQLIYPTTVLELPVIPDMKKRPRMQFLDTGIVNHALGIHADIMGLEDLGSAYKGALLPHLITQEFLSLNEMSFTKPNFWVREKKHSQAEVDLVRPHHGLLIPIEVKSGPTGRLRSLHQFIDRSPHSYAVRIHGGKFSITKNITPDGKPYTLMSLPYYLATYIDPYLEYFMNQ